MGLDKVSGIHFQCYECSYSVIQQLVWHSYKLPHHFVGIPHPDIMNQLLIHLLWMQSSGKILVKNRSFHNDWTPTTRWKSCQSLLVRQRSACCDHFRDHWLGQWRLLVTHIKIRKFRSLRPKWTPRVVADRVIFPYLMCSHLSDPWPEKVLNKHYRL